MTKVYILRVFTDAQGNFGNLASVVFDEERKLSDAERLAITRRLHHDETVFVNNLQNPDVSIFNPLQEVHFAGHPMMGAAWLLNKQARKPIETIYCLVGDIKIRQESDLTRVCAGLDMMPPWLHKQLASSEAVDRISSKEAASMEHTMAWAWVDEPKGLIRARTFALDWEIPEAEANGSGSMMLAAILGRDIEITHGEGSVIYARPVGNSEAEIGGRVKLEPAIII